MIIFTYYTLDFCPYSFNMNEGILKGSKHLEKLSIRVKLIGLLIATLAVVMTLVTIISLNLFKGQVEDIFQNETAEKIAFLNTYLDSYIETPIHLVENTAETIKKTFN